MASCGRQSFRYAIVFFTSYMIMGFFILQQSNTSAESKHNMHWSSITDELKATFSDLTFKVKRTKLEKDTDGERRPTCTVPALESLRQYKNYIYNRQAICNNWVDLGGHFGRPGDSRKFICMDAKFNIRPGDCIVLSFGVNNEWSFEEDAERLGCKVYAFDPTIGLQDHKRSENIHFYNLGISNYRGLKKIGMNKIPTDFNFTEEFPVDTYSNILGMLGLTDTPIDIIKMDVELSEIDFFQDVLHNTPHLLRNIKQMAVEIHHDVMKGDIGPTSYQRIYWMLYHQLKCHGFDIYMSRFGGFFREVVWGRVADW